MCLSGWAAFLDAEVLIQHLGHAAVQVIESLLDETDQDPHTHYLYAMVSGNASVPLGLTVQVQ